MKVQDALKHFRNKADLARAFGITRASVTKWDKAGKIPKGRALELQYEILPAMKGGTKP